MTKALRSFIFIALVLVVTSACGGSPSAPSYAITFTPNPAIIKVGESVMVTVSGVNGALSCQQPASGTLAVSGNQVKYTAGANPGDVTLTCNGQRGSVIVQAPDGPQIMTLPTPFVVMKDIATGKDTSLTVRILADGFTPAPGTDIFATPKGTPCGMCQALKAEVCVGAGFTAGSAQFYFSENLGDFHWGLGGGSTGGSCGIVDLTSTGQNGSTHGFPTDGPLPWLEVKMSQFNAQHDLTSEVKAAAAFYVGYR